VNSIASAAQIPVDTVDRWADRVREARFAFVPAAELRPMLDAATDADWNAFAASWDRLLLDTYMADGGRYRRRRYATLSAEVRGRELHVEPHQPHYQGLDYNRLHGGIARHFEPIEAGVLASATMQSVLQLGLGLFQRLFPARPAHVEVHQFRIEARADASGQPTPEGAHRDGVDFVLVTLVQRRNVASGTTEIFDTAQRKLDSFTLAAPGDMALVDDHRAFHGVTAITPVDAAAPAWRDVLVATYRSR
jgi:hypothetical protein